MIKERVTKKVLQDPQLTVGELEHLLGLGATFFNMSGRNTRSNKLVRNAYKDNAKIIKK